MVRLLEIKVQISSIQGISMEKEEVGVDNGWKEFTDRKSERNLIIDVEWGFKKQSNASEFHG